MPIALYIVCVFVTFGHKCTPISRRCVKLVPVVHSPTQVVALLLNLSTVFLLRLHFVFSLWMHIKWAIMLALRGVRLSLSLVAG